MNDCKRPEEATVEALERSRDLVREMRDMADMFQRQRDEAKSEVERLQKLLREERDARVPRLVNEALGESDE